MKSKIKGYMQESEIISQLQAMEDDATFITDPGYSIDSETYPDNIVPFAEAHMNYLVKHSQVDPAHYLSNLRLMLKMR